MAAGGHGAQLALQLAVALEALNIHVALCDRGFDRAAGFAAMLAIVEPAFRGEMLDVFENVPDRVRSRPELGLAKTGSVDDHAASRKLNQLAMARHVTALAGALNGARLHDL